MAKFCILLFQNDMIATLYFFIYVMHPSDLANVF